MADKRKGLSRAKDDPRPWVQYRKLARENIAFNWQNENTRTAEAGTLHLIKPL